MREVIFEPSVVTLSAPQNILSTLSEVISTPIDLTDRRTSFTEKVGVELPRNVLLSGDPLIQARVVIELAESSREFSVSPQFP